MTESFRDEENRDEFDWEKEIRKDDERVHDYLSELPRFIDLPEEDKVIYKRIRRHGDGWEDFAPIPEDDGYDDDPDDEDDVPEEDFLSRRDGSSIYAAASKMAIDLTDYFAVEKDNSSARAMMRSLAILGKLMARSLDILRLDDGELLPFRIALTKRFLFDVNELIGEYEKFPESIRESFLRDAFTLRDNALAKLNNYRAASKKK